MTESRVKKSLLNARVNLAFYFVSLILSFFSRKIFLNTLGADFVGLTGTLYNLLAFLNLAELGIGSAIGYVLYRPIFDQDKERINEIISVFGYLYRIVGFIILGVGCILGCFLPLIFPAGTGFDLGLIYFAYFSFLSSSLIGYFINYRQTLLGADQKNYVITVCYQSVTIIKVIIQMASAYYTKNYYLWVAIELVFGIIFSLVLNWKLNKVYPWLRSEIKEGKKLLTKYPEVITKTKQLFVHQIAGFVLFQTKSLFIYMFVSLKIVAYYGNYTIFVDKLFQLVNNLLGSTNASIGNLIAEGKDERVKSVFWEITAIRFYVAGIFVFGLYVFLEPFIILWLGHEYVLGKTILILIIADCAIRLVSDALGQFLYGYGLFHDTWAPVVQAIVYALIAIIGGYYKGIEGILFAAVVGFLSISLIWKSYFLFRSGFRTSYIYYWIGFFKCLLPIVISYALFAYFMGYFQLNFDKSFSYLFFVGTATISLYSILSLILMILMTSEMSNVVRRFIIKKK